jgi:hypothetical protein
MSPVLSRLNRPGRRQAKPNLKRRRVLELRGFTVENIEGAGEVYRYLHQITGGSKNAVK